MARTITDVGASKTLLKSTTNERIAGTSIAMALINKHEEYVWFFEIDHTNEFKISKRPSPMLFNFRDWDDGWNYVYIEVKSSDAFAHCDINDYINPDYIKHIKDKDSDWLLYINNTHEAFLDMPREVYQHVCKKYDIPTSKVVLANGAFDLLDEAERVTQLHDVPVFKIERVMDFEFAHNNIKNSLTSQSNDVPETLVPSDIHKTFLCFNRRWRLHRPLLVSCLAANDMLKDGFVSLAPSDDNKNIQNHVPGENEGGVFQWLEHCCERNAVLDEWITPNKAMIQSLQPMYLDTEDLRTNRAEFEWGPGYLYAQSLVSVVTETNYFTSFHKDNTTERSIFFSEKIFKPIAFEHPFIVVSTPNFLESLRSVDYKTFDGLIDESYDQEPDDFKRMVMIVNEIKRLINLTPLEKAEFCAKAKPICKHNKLVLEGRSKFNYKINY